MVSPDVPLQRKLSILLPVLLLVAASTVAAIPPSATAGAQSSDGFTLPSLPTWALEIGAGPPAALNLSHLSAEEQAWFADRETVVATVSSHGIPAAALAAYQRAAQVMSSADAGCNLPWTLLAAVGRVESDHGRYGGNVLSAEGTSMPGIYGIPLDGTSGTREVRDTDVGLYDHDRIFDRAVGPMQFIPSTWLVVGVDADGDGERNPQDVDDASLAAAVYLCSGEEDLATDQGARAAVYRYNHSNQYVALVLAIAAAYLRGVYDVVPTNAYAQTWFGPSYGDSVLSGETRGDQAIAPQGAIGPGPATDSPQPATPAAPSPPTAAPSPDQPSQSPEQRRPVKKLKDVVTGAPAVVSQALTELQQAALYCQERLAPSQIDLLGGLAACAQAYVAGGVDALETLLAGLGLGGLIGGLLGP